MMMTIGLLDKYSLEHILLFLIETIVELVFIINLGFSNVDGKNLNSNKNEILVQEKAQEINNFAKIE
jgi:hypothetical protein